MDPLGILAFKTDFLVYLGSDCDVYAVKPFPKLHNRNILSDCYPHMDIDIKGQHLVNLLLEKVPWQTVVWNPVAEHSSKVVLAFVEVNLVTHEGQKVCCGKSAWTSTYDCNPLAGSSSRLWKGNIPCIVNSKSLETPYVDGVIHHVPSASCLTWMLTYIGAGKGHWVVLPDQPYGIVVSFLVYQGYVAWYVHSCRT